MLCVVKTVTMHLADLLNWSQSQPKIQISAEGASYITLGLLSNIKRKLLYNMGFQTAKIFLT